MSDAIASFEKAAFSALTDQIKLYFDGLYHGDVVRLAQVFHARAIYVCASDDPMVELDMARYFDIVTRREAPAARGEQRSDRIVSIRFAGPETALVIANCAIGEKYFTDHLNFVKTGGKWQIIAKVFHYDLISTS